MVGIIAATIIYFAAANCDSALSGCLTYRWIIIIEKIKLSIHATSLALEKGT